MPDTPSDRMSRQASLFGKFWYRVWDRIMLYFVGQKRISPSTFRMFLRPKNREFREAFALLFSDHIELRQLQKDGLHTTGFGLSVSRSITTP